MQNPVLEALVHHRVAEIVDPPRSWKSDMKAAFLRLPRDLQIYFARHDRETQLVVKRAQQERSDALKKLAGVEAQLASTQDRLDRAEAKLAEQRTDDAEVKNTAA